MRWSPQKIIIIILCSMGSVSGTIFGRQLYGLILPSMKVDLGLSYSELGLLQSIYSLGYVFSALIVGILATKYGIRIVMGISTILMGGSLYLTGSVVNFPQLVIIRALGGVFNSGAAIGSHSLPIAWFPREERGLASGIIGSSSGMTNIIMGLFLPLIILNSAAGWRQGWFVLSILAAVFGMFILMFARNAPLLNEKTIKEKKEKEKQGKNITLTLRNWRLLIINKSVLSLALLLGMFGIINVIFTTYAVAFLINERNLDPLLAGKIWSGMGLASVFGGIFWGVLSDRIGRQKSLALSFGSIIVSIVLLLFTHPLLNALSVIFYGFAFGGPPFIIPAALGDTVGSYLMPSALGFVTVVSGLGQTLGAYLGGRLADITGSLLISFIITVVIGVIAVSFSLLLKSKGGGTSVSYLQ